MIPATTTAKPAPMIAMGWLRLVAHGAFFTFARLPRRHSCGNPTTNPPAGQWICQLSINGLQTGPVGAAAEVAQNPVEFRCARGGWVIEGAREGCVSHLTEVAIGYGEGQG